MINLFIDFVFAQQLPFGELPPDINCGANFFACLSFFFGKFLRVIVTLAFVLAAIFIAWGGIEYIFYGSDENKRKAATQRLIWGAWGLIVALMAYAFVVFIERAVRENKVFLTPVVYASIQEPSVPMEIKCGSVNLPSVLKSTSISAGDIWKTCILYYLRRFISFLYGVALAIGVFFLAWAGILYITQPEKTKDIHPKLFYGILGIVIAILSFTIVKVINFFFNNLS